ncbi:MAG: ImmA/IrrE family metallo-endopeptidase [Thaumarchaeota archaeon]|jgi:HTH-type transcriptional regulator/antitoxin HigA|nr:ImmA/IrrE family metallo-endopeptidase [Nitrososphaerota archaeon]
MGKIKVIKNKDDYQEALKLVEELMDHDPDPNSEEGDQLSILTALVRDYETKNFPSSLPSPTEAIKFRMEQADLKAVDLIPYLGSRSRVSEILSGKRQLTVDMIRALSEGLGIPAKVLIRTAEPNEDSEYQNWDTHLMKEMAKRGYFGNVPLRLHSGPELLKEFFSSVGSPVQFAALLRKSNYRSVPREDRRALSAWACRVVQKAKEVKGAGRYRHGVVNLAFMQELARLSVNENGPVLAQGHLRKYGIIVVVEPHLSKTYLDGATIFADKGNPIIGLTLRYDRLDNFWFTLMHELAHVVLHYGQEISLFYDELDDVKGVDIGSQEREADNLASEALVPSSKWEISPAKLIPSSIAATSLAKELGVNVAIIAGKIRHEGGKWTYLNSIVGKEKVRKCFPGEKWIDK